MPKDDFVDVGQSTRVSAKPPDTANPPQNEDDAYPAVILDQRSMLPDGKFCDTAEQMFWNCWVPFLAMKGQTPRLREGHVVPYINQSRWVADCHGCNGGMACWDRNPYACCLTCGSVYKVNWQPPAARAEVIRIIAGWPVHNRSWNAHEGETVEHLKLQSILMRGVDVAERNGLIVAANLDVPDNLATPQDYIEQLRIDALKRGNGRTS